MAFESTRRLMGIAIGSLLLWAFTWLWAFVWIPFSGAQFWYLFFGIAEPFIFLLVAFTSIPAGLLFTIIATQFGLHIVAAILRLLTITRPIVVGELTELTFVFLEFIAVIVYLWYTYNVYRYATAVDATKRDKDK